MKLFFFSERLASRLRWTLYSQKILNLIRFDRIVEYVKVVDITTKIPSTQVKAPYTGLVAPEVIKSSVTSRDASYCSIHVDLLIFKYKKKEVNGWPKTLRYDSRRWERCRLGMSGANLTVTGHSVDVVDAAGKFVSHGLLKSGPILLFITNTIEDRMCIMLSTFRIYIRGCLSGVACNMYCPTLCVTCLATIFVPDFPLSGFPRYLYYPHPRHTHS